MRFNEFCEIMHKTRDFIGPDFNDADIKIRFFNDNIANCHLELVESKDMYMVFALGVNIDASVYPLHRVLNTYEDFLNLEQFVNNIHPSVSNPNSFIDRTICCVYYEHVISDVDLFNINIKDFNKEAKPVINILSKYKGPLFRNKRDIKE